MCSITTGVAMQLDLLTYVINIGGNKMLEHLTNCHGEWNALFALIGSIPLVGIWLRTKLFKEEVCDDEHR